MSNKFVLILLLTYFLSSSALRAAESDWLCTEESSQRRGNQILSCGVAIGIDENTAREAAFENARTEFSNLCDNSSDCKDHLVVVTPNRTTCEKIGNEKESAYKCYRLVTFEVAKESDQSRSDTEAVSASSTFDRAQYECSEKVFDKTLAKDPGQVTNPSCSSKSGTSTPYKIALNFYKQGVMEGYCSLFTAHLQGVIDAEAAFKMGSEGSSKLRDVTEKCEMNVQKLHERSLSELSTCFNTPVVTGIIDVGKTCGETMFWKYGSKDYIKYYRNVCMLKQKNGKTCAKLADAAYVNYLIRFGAELQSGTSDPFAPAE